MVRSVGCMLVLAARAPAAPVYAQDMPADAAGVLGALVRLGK